MNIVETQRLAIREFEESDAAFVLDILNQPSFIKYIADRGVRTLKQAQDYIRSRFETAYDSNSYGIFLVELKDTGEPVGMAGYLSWLFPRCKISPKLNGTAPHFGDEMFALVLFVCYLDGGCEDIVVDVYNTEQQCLHSMSDQRIRHGGCFPIEDFIDGFWRPAQEYGDF